ncbi:hypothetical protein ACFC4C_12615 [Streptomyces sp. NPDC056039]|uniref:hypothetical protein n=1 Tax=Streptomyces sp. NPDC056039 TaxID=3345687 RepID=UPI0035DD578D
MKHFVLVAGYGKPPRQLPFRAYCENRVRQHVAANKAMEDLVFQIFDVGSGEVVARTFTYPAGRRTESVAAVRSFVRVTPAHYDGNAFQNDVRGVMSVLEVYAAVRTIGVTAPGTLMELSFFSHGYDGPVLVDSFDYRQTSEMLRDPGDLDPRPKDFHSANMPPAELSAFQAAYHPDGINWSWGCHFQKSYHHILTKLEFHPEYRSSGLPDGKVLVFRNFDADETLLLGDHLGRTFPDHRKVEVTFGELKWFFRRHILAGYCHALAVHSGRKTYGGLLGTYAERDTTGSRPLMHVNRGFGRHLAFYRNYFGFALDPERRWYGLYDPAFT